VSLIKRFSAKTLHVGLAPERLTSVVRHGTSYVAASAASQQIDNPACHWQPLLNQLQSTLQQSDSPAHGLPVSVVLSSRWCRMMMIPWSDAMLEDDSAEHFLQSQYVALYGDEALGWTIAVDDAPYGHPRLACAIERELLQSLHQLVSDSKSRCQLVEPVISAAWRIVARLSGLSTKAFAIIEGDRLSLACAIQGKITAIQSQACGKDWTGELVRAWQRWILRMPAFADIARVAVLDLSGEAVKQELPKPFEWVLLSAHGLEPVYGFLACGGER
jgi:hypothetical protein